MKRVFLFGNASGKASVIVRIAVMAAVTLIVQWLFGVGVKFRFSGLSG